jgi:hypothetical protein
MLDVDKRRATNSKSVTIVVLEMEESDSVGLEDDLGGKHPQVITSNFRVPEAAKMID